MPPRLSARQEQCIRLTAFRTDKEIAAHLGISEATVKKHVHEACQRLGVNRRKAALAILGQMGPGPNDPMAEPSTPRFDAIVEGKTRNGQVGGSAAAMELGRAGDRPGSAGNGGSGSSGARAHDVRPEGRGGGSDILDGPSDVGSGDGGTAVANARFGYRTPPRGSLLRLTLIGITAIVLAAMLITVGSLVSEFHHVVERFDPEAD